MVTKQGRRQVSGDVEKANLLKSFFATLFTQENVTNILRMPDRSFQNTLDDKSINEGKGKKMLASLKTDKASEVQRTTAKKCLS